MSKPQPSMRTAKSAVALALDELQHVVRQHFGVDFQDWPPQFRQAIVRALRECYRRGANDVHERLTVKPPPGDE